MGWCSATEIFDTVISALKDPAVSRKKAIVEFIKTLEDGDWDCQWDSDWIDDPEVREAFIEAGSMTQEDFDEYDASKS